MKRRLILIAIGFVLGLALVAGVQIAGAGKNVTTYHVLMTATTNDDAYILCDSGQLVITANGADSLYVQCVPVGDK